MSTEAILFVLTAVTGVVDAVSFLALGRVFTANMTGNVVLLGFAVSGAPGLSAARSFAALLSFLTGAVLGGRLVLVTRASYALGVEATLLSVASLLSLALNQTQFLYPVIALTALAMGVRNATVRKLAIPDLTTTVLTLTVTGLAADSSLAGGENPRWQRRVGAILAMCGGAAAGASLLGYSVALPLGIAAVTVFFCAFAMFRNEIKGGQKL